MCTFWDIRADSEPGPTAGDPLFSFRETSVKICDLTYSAVGVVVLHCDRHVEHKTWNSQQFEAEFILHVAKVPSRLPSRLPTASTSFHSP